MATVSEDDDHRRKSVEDKQSYSRALRDQVQEKTFTNWVNSYLDKADPPAKINNVTTDLRSGQNLLLLLQVLANRPFKINKHAGRFPSRDNVIAALTYLTGPAKLNLVNIRADDIVDGNATLTLGLVWSIMLRFQMTDTGEDQDSKQVLLKWVDHTLKRVPGVSADNFNCSTWQDGMAFNGVIAGHKPELVDMNAVRAMSATDRLTNAFTVGEKRLGAPPLIEAGDVSAGHVDDKSIMAYVAQLYNVLPHDLPEDSPDGVVVEVDEKDSEELRKYHPKLVDLQQKLAAGEDMLGNPQTGDDFATVKLQLAEHQEFMKTSLSTAEQANMKDVVGSGRNLLRSGKAGKKAKKVKEALVDLSQRWNALNTRATKRQQDLLSKLGALQDIRLQMVEDWLTDLEEAQRKQETISHDLLKQREEELSQQQKILSEVMVVDVSADGQKEMDARLADIRERWENVNRFVLIRLLQGLVERTQKLADSKKPDREELRSLKTSLEEHEPQLHTLEADTKALVAKHHNDPSAQVIKKEVDILSSRWRDLVKALQYKLDTLDREESQTKEWREKADRLKEFLDEEEENTLQPALPLHDLDSTTELLGQHQELLHDKMQKRRSDLDDLKWMSEKFTDPAKKAEIGEEYAEIEKHWNDEEARGTQREKELAQAQVQLQRFEGRVDDLAQFLAEVENLVLLPFDESLSPEEQRKLMDRYQAAKAEYVKRQSDMDWVEATANDLVEKAPPGADTSELQTEMQTLTERWEDAGILLDGRIQKGKDMKVLSQEEADLDDWLNAVQAKANEIKTCGDLSKAIALSKEVSQELHGGKDRIDSHQSKCDSSDGGDSGLADLLGRYDNMCEDSETTEKQMDLLKDLLDKLEAFESSLSNAEKDMASADEDKKKAVVGAVPAMGEELALLQKQSADLLSELPPELGDILDARVAADMKRYDNLKFNSRGDGLLDFCKRISANLKDVRPPATDIPKLNQQMAEVQELQDMVDQAQKEGTELTESVRALSPNQQEALEPKLVELDQELAALIDRASQRGEDVNNQLECATPLNKQLGEELQFLERTRQTLEAMGAPSATTKEKELRKMQETLENIALEVGDHRVPVDELDKNFQGLMEVSLDEDCVETRENVRKLHQAMDTDIDLLKKKLLATRTALDIGRLSTDSLMAELAEMKTWLEAVDRWLIMQESEPNIMSDPGRAHQLLTKYEAVLDDLSGRHPTMERINRDVMVLSALEDPTNEMQALQQERDNVDTYFDEVWERARKAHHILEKTMPQVMVTMADWLARVNEWLKAQNPGSAIADGAGDMGLMNEDLVKCEQDLAERQPAMKSIAATCQQRLCDPEMTVEASQSLQKQLEKLQETYATTVSTVKLKQHWLHVYNDRARNVQERLAKQILWLSQNEQSLAAAQNPAVDLPVLEKQIEEHNGFMDVVSGQRDNTIRLQRHAAPLMLQATRASPPSSSATPLSSPAQSDNEDTPLPPLPPCKLHDAITQLLHRLQALYARSTQRQHQLEDARQQLHELMSGMKALHNWMDASDKRISDPPAVRNHRKLQEQLEQLMAVKAEVSQKRERLQQLNEHCSEFLDSSTGADQNSAFMNSLAELNDAWAEFLAKLDARQALLEEAIGANSERAMKFAAEHAAALEWMMQMEEQLSSAVVCNADVEALRSHQQQHKDLVGTIPSRQKEVDDLTARGKELAEDMTDSPEDAASIENQLQSLETHWVRILQRSKEKTGEFGVALPKVEGFYADLRVFKDFLKDAEDTLTCADTIGGIKTVAELQDLLVSLPDRKVELDSLNQRGDELVNANRDLSAAAALKSELYQVNKRFEALKHRLAKWARELGLDKDFYKLLADLLGWLANAEQVVAARDPPVKDQKAIEREIAKLKTLQNEQNAEKWAEFEDMVKAQCRLADLAASRKNDEDSDRAEHAKAEVGKVKERMDKLATDITAKLERLQPEEETLMELVPEVEGTPWDFSGFSDSAPSNNKEDLMKWIQLAESELVKPRPPPESAAIEKRIEELEALCEDVDSHRPVLETVKSSDINKQECDELDKRFSAIDTQSAKQLVELRDLLRRVKKMEVDMKQVEYWLEVAEPVAVVFSRGEQTDGGQSAEGLRDELPDYQQCLMSVTVDAQSFIVDDRNESDGVTSTSLSLLAERLERLNESMDRVARLLTGRPGANERDIERWARELGLVEDKYRELMQWLEDQEAVLRLPVQENDFPAIEEALRTAKNCQMDLKTNRRPERDGFTERCDDLIEQFRVGDEVNEIQRKRVELNNRWDEVDQVDEDRIRELEAMLLKEPGQEMIREMPLRSAPPTSSPKDLLAWLREHHLPKAIVADVDSCHHCQETVKETQIGLNEQAANYLSATESGTDAEDVAALDNEWSTVQTQVKEMDAVFPKLEEDSVEFDGEYRPLLMALTDAQKSVTAPLQDPQLKYGPAAVRDELGKCRAINASVDDWELKLADVHNNGQALVKRYRPVEMCDTVPLEKKLEQLAYLLENIRQNSKARQEKLEQALLAWNEYEATEKRLSLLAVETNGALSEMGPVPKEKADIAQQLGQSKELLANLEAADPSVHELKNSSDQLRGLYAPMDAGPIVARTNKLVEQHKNLEDKLRKRIMALEEDDLWSKKLLECLSDLIEWLMERDATLSHEPPVAGTVEGVDGQWDTHCADKPRAFMNTLKRKAPEVEENIRDADRLLLLGRKNPSQRIDNQSLNTLETYLNDATSRWGQLNIDAKEWEDKLNSARTDFHALQNAMNALRPMLDEAEAELAAQGEPSRIKSQLRGQMIAHEDFMQRLAPMEDQCQGMENWLHQLIGNDVDVDRGVRKDVALLRQRLDALKREAEERDRMLRLAHQQSIQPMVEPSLPEGWFRSENDERTPFFFNPDFTKVQWDHPDLTKEYLKLPGFNYVKLAPYRTALKVRALQKSTQMHLAPLKTIKEVITHHGLEGQSETHLAVLEVGNVLSSVFSLMADAHIINKDRVVTYTDVLLTWLLSVFDTDRSGRIRAFSLKVALLLLCRGRVAEKVQYLLNQVADQLGYVEKRTIAIFLFDANMFPKNVLEGCHFIDADVEPALDACFLRSNAQRHIPLSAFLEWLALEPRVLSWLWALQRLSSSDLVQHDVRCAVCRAQPIRGLRYKSMKQFGFNLCQDCFWEGRATRNHKLYHPVQEYTQPAKSGESVRDVGRVLRNKGSKYKKQQEPLASEFRILSFEADADRPVPHQYLKECFVALHPEAASEERRFRPGSVLGEMSETPSNSGVGSPNKGLRSPSTSKPLEKVAEEPRLQEIEQELMWIEEDSKQLQLQIVQMSLLDRAVPCVSLSVSGSQPLQQELKESVGQQMWIVQQHRKLALSEVETLRKKRGAGYVPGADQFDGTPLSPVSAQNGFPPADMEWPMDDALDLFAKQVSSAFTDKSPDKQIVMPAAMDDLRSSMNAASQSVGGIVRAATLGQTTADGASSPSDEEDKARFYVSERGSILEQPVANPHRYQVSQNPPTSDWRVKFTFKAYKQQKDNTQQIFVSETGSMDSHHDPLCFKLSTDSESSGWHDIFSFYAFGEQQADTMPVYVCETGGRDRTVDPYRFSLSLADSVPRGWRKSFVFFAYPDEPPGTSNGVNGFSISSLLS